MQTQEITYHAKLVATYTDSFGYVNYVFQDLEYTNPDYKYMMCVKFPNWESPHIDIEDIGYVTVKYVREGIDKLYDGSEFVTYKYTNIIFLKFIQECEKTVVTAITID